MTPGDTDITPQLAKNAIKLAMGRAPYGEETQFVALQEAEIGDPILVCTAQGKESFWLAPLLAGDLACGFATVDLHGNVTRVGIFGGAPNDRVAWVKADFFKAPPPESLAEIAAHYPDRSIATPTFSHDGNPAKWGWMVSATRVGAPPAVIFITPGGWYEQRTAAQGDFEG